ncbi:MAG TPA: hypothetical protein VGR97_12330 [Candidatus Acidoferrales bacterium]|nr:hypothetical protein [Candidatus Acidoferrales bacterium]HEV3483102.1 hypothetical protein [Candidatus Acidoferrales bacterium]
MTRRIQSAALILALLAAPLALLSRSYACTASQCTMICCLPHKHAMNMNCAGSGSAGSSACALQCNSNKNIDYGLASPLAPTQLANGLSLPAPTTARLFSFFPRNMASPGFIFEPFKPPRA